MNLKNLILPMFCLQFIVACQSSRTPEPSHLPPPKAVILYASDASDFKKEFSDKFTQQLVNENVFYATKNVKIQERWIKNTADLNLNADRDTMLKLISDVRNAYQTLSVQETKNVSHNALLKAQDILSHTRVKLNSEYAELAFFDAVINYSNTRVIGYSSNIYFNLIEPEQKKLLDQQTSPKILEIMRNNSSSGRRIELKNTRSCAVYANGQPIHGQSFISISGGNNVVSAVCPTGTFSKIFNGDQTSSIAIQPVEGLSPVMPNLNGIHKLISRLNVDDVIFMYYSSKDKFLKISLYDLHLKKFLQPFLLSLEDKDNVLNAGKLSLSFLREKSEEIRRSGHLIPNQKIKYATQEKTTKLNKPTKTTRVYRQKK